MSTKRRGHGDGSIMRRKDGRWHARLRYVDPISGFAERLSFYGPTRGDVVDQLDSARSRLRARQAPRDEGTTLAAWLDLWLRDIVGPTKRVWTVRSYTNIVENHLKPSRLGGMALRDIHEVQIQHVIISGSKEATRTQQLCLIVLRLALEQAVRWGLLASNPAKGIAAPRLAHRELRALSAAEAQRFLAVASDDRLYALYYLALDTGMRQGELFALEWRDIDLSAGRIQVVRSMNTATGEVGPTKTRSSRRRIDLGISVKNVLLAHEARLKAEGHSGPLVFPSPGGSPLSPSNVRIRSFLPIQKASKINPPIRFHDLRHTAATLLLSRGVHPKIVSERLGHASIAITIDTYSHVIPSMQREVAELMGSILSPPRQPAKRVGVKPGRQGAGNRTSRTAKGPAKR